MKDITMIHMAGCPYCKNAFLAIEELKSQNSSYQSINIITIDETKEPERASAFDSTGYYYYVPSMFIDGEKLYEAHPGEDYEACKKNVEQVLKAAMA